MRERHAAVPSRRCLATALAACLLAGACAVKPEPSGDQVRAQALSAVVIPPNWSAQASQAQVDEAWLDSFQDPRLRELVHLALARNPDLQIAAARVEQANAQVEIARAQLFPAVGLIGRGGSKPIADLVPLLSGIMLRVSWELDLWGRLRYARNAAMASRDAQGADYRYAQQSLAASVARAWFVATEAGMQRDIAAQMAEHGQRLQALAEQRERTGVGSNSDTQAARASAVTYLDASQQASLAYLSAVRALELLLGEYPGAHLPVADRLTTFPGPVPAGIPADMLNRRPDLHAAERRVAAAFDRVGEARAAMLPALSISAGYGRLSNEVIETREDLEQTTSSVAVTGILPIYTGGALTGQVRLRSAEQKQAVADYTRRALLALAEVEDALSAERVLGERERLLSDGVEANAQATRQAQQAWRIGKADMRAVHSQQIATLAAQSALLGVQRERLSRRVDLHLALGGDFGVPALADSTESSAAAPAGNAAGEGVPP